MRRLILAAAAAAAAAVFLLPPAGATAVPVAHAAAALPVQVARPVQAARPVHVARPVQAALPVQAGAIGFFHYYAYTDPKVGPRNYYVQYEPGNTTPRPLLIALHGYRHTVGTLRSNTVAGLDAFAAARHIVLAYGEGNGGSWNAGPPCCGRALSLGLDDVAYLRAVVANIAARTPIDATRVYVIGFSNGGMMAARAALEAPEVFAGACAMSGDLNVTAVTPVRLCEFHDPKDTTVPWNGGAGLDGMVFPPVWSVPLRLAYGSVWVEYPHSSGHAWPPGGTDRAWQILSGWHL